MFALPPSTWRHRAHSVDARTKRQATAGMVEVRSLWLALTIRTHQRRADSAQRYRRGVMLERPVGPQNSLSLPVYHATASAMISCVFNP
jgi:hypothetical protein